MTTKQNTPGAFLTTVGNYSVNRDTTGALYVVRDAQGAEVGTYPTARAATEAAFQAIVAARGAK